MPLSSGSISPHFEPRGRVGRGPSVMAPQAHQYDLSHVAFQLTTEHDFPAVDFLSEDGTADALREAGTDATFKVMYAAAGENGEALLGWQPFADFMPSDPASGDETMVVGQMQGFAHITV